MPMFCFDKSHYDESKLIELLQDEFFTTARRNKILAKWAGGRLGLEGGALGKYVRKVIFGYVLVPNDRIMIEKILADFKKADILMSEDIVVQKLKSTEKRIKNKARMKNNTT